MSNLIPVELLAKQLQSIPGLHISVDDNRCTGTMNQFAATVKFREWALHWLTVYKKGTVKDNTYNSTYREPIELHLIPFFGDAGLSEIRPEDVQEYFKLLKDELSLETQKKIRNVFKMLYDEAIDSGLCQFNPVRKSLKLVSNIKPVEKHTWTLEEYDTAYQFALHHPNGLQVITLMETAISRSELLGLRWEDHNSKKGVLYIQNGLVAQKSTITGKYELVNDGLKNQYRRRMIPVSSLLNGLLSLKPQVIYVGGNLKKGEAPRKVRPEFIFHSPKGIAYDPNNWYRRILCGFMRDLHKEHPEVTMLTTHELRHTHRTSSGPLRPQYAGKEIRT